MDDMRIRYAVPAAVLAATLSLAGCGDSPGETSSETTEGLNATPSASESASPSESASESAGGSASPTAKPSPRGQVIEISIENGEIDPSGERVKATIGKPVTLRITADQAGELHVHSTPEQQIAFEAGTSTKKLTIDQPGIVDVEEHELGQVIVQLQVS
jgi:hypothetical protein